MVIRLSRFNIYLLLAAALITAAGCHTFSAKSKKQIATLRIHLEAPRDPSGMTEKVFILRASPIAVTIEKIPFLNEVHIASAKVVEGNDGFLVSIQLDQQGQRLLEQYSSSNPQRRFAIRSQFRNGTNVIDRWLAAPLVTRRISDGTLLFSPDADRQETDSLVKGLNNAADAPEPKKKEDKKIVDGGTQ